MNPAEWAAWAQAFAGLGTFAAACVAVKASYDAPRRAAEFAERLRVDSAEDAESRRLKLLVFTNLMQFRAQLLNPVAVASLNLIDVVYRDEREVREAWHHFLIATDGNDGTSIRERYLALVEKMARALNLQEQISVSDIQRAYYPRAMLNADEAANLEIMDKLRRLKPDPIEAVGNP